jgi:carbon-monoxide dehydrogenase iron sulfur subunit
MKIIVTDLKKCVGCHTCELACAVSRSVSKNLFQAFLEEPRPATRVRIVRVGKQAVPLQCQQCEDAPCAAVCPSQALSRAGAEQTVLFRRELCIGCSSCTLVCPFGAIRRADGGVMAKCSLCWDRLAEGKPPACVEACPTKARHLVDANVVAEAKLRKTALAIAGVEDQQDGLNRSAR